MKKVISLVLVLLFCAMPLFSCAAAITLTGFYADAVTNINNASTVEARITLSGTMRQDGATAPIQMQTTVRYEGKDLEIRSQYAVSQADANTFCYKLIDGKSYGERNGTAIDGAKAAEAVRGMTGITVADPQIMKLQLVPVFTPEQLNDYQLTIKSNGIYAFELAAINGTSFQTLPMLSELTKQATFSDVSGELHFTALHQFAGFQVDFDMASSGASASLSYQIEFLSIGGNANVEDPEKPNDGETTDGDETTDGSGTTTGNPSNPTPPDEDLTAAKLYKDAVAALHQANAMESEMIWRSTNPNDDFQIEYRYLTKVKNKDMVMEGFTKYPGVYVEEEAIITLIYVDECFYWAMLETKEKGTVSHETMKESFESIGYAYDSSYDTINPPHSIPTYTDNDLKNVTVTENTDGTYQFSLELTKEVVEEFKNPLVKSSVYDRKISNATTTFVFDKQKNLSSCTLSYECRDESDVLLQTVFYSVTFSNINGNVVVSAPADADTYELIENIEDEFLNHISPTPQQ